MKIRMRDEKGLTLMELMMVVTIMGIIASVGVYNLLRDLPSYRLRQTAHRLAGTIQYLKVRAVTTNHITWLKVDYSGADHYFTGFVDDPPGGTTTTAEYNNSKLDLPDTVSGNPVLKLPPTVSFGFPTGFSGGTGPDATAFPGSGNFINLTDKHFGFRPTGVPCQEFANPKTATIPTVIYLTNTKGEGFAVSTQITGRVRVYQWNGSQWI
jgi:prepilin-type N-terminal cleavage/methylation domain-containing protein